MLTAVPFDSTHIGHFNELMVAHGFKKADYSTIPAIGWVVRHDSVPVAYAFLRRVEGGYGQLDGLIVNPDFHGEIRSQALDMAIEYAISSAKDAGIINILAFCRDKAPIERALKHGFGKLPHTLLALNLTKEV